jgi:Flp pilus assembly protein TadG
MSGTIIARLVRRAADARHGATSIEFALVMALFLLPLVIGVIDLGLGLFVQMEVGNSARAGAEYATYCRCADDKQILPVVQTTIKTAEQSATGLGTAVTAHTAQFCGCINASGSVTLSFSDGTSTTVTGLSLAPGAVAYTDPVLNVATQGTLPSCDTSSTTQCSDGTSPGTYVAVTATTTYTPMIPYPGIVPASGSFSPTATATARIY